MSRHTLAIIREHLVHAWKELNEHLRWMIEWEDVG